MSVHSLPTLSLHVSDRKGENKALIKSLSGKTGRRGYYIGQTNALIM